MLEAVDVDRWTLISFRSASETPFFVVIGLDFQGTGLCSERLEMLTLPVDGEVGQQLDAEHPVHHGSCLTVTDSLHARYRLLGRAPKGEISWPALEALLNWCSDRYGVGDFGIGTLSGLKDAISRSGKPRPADHANPVSPGIATRLLAQQHKRGSDRSLQEDAGPNEITCLDCGWISYAVTRAEAERMIESFNRYFDRLPSKDQQRFYAGRRADLSSYRCINCGNGDDLRFRPARASDSPYGVTVNPVVCDRLAAPNAE